MEPLTSAWVVAHAVTYVVAVILPAPALGVLGVMLWRHTLVTEGGDPIRGASLHRKVPPLVVGLIERVLYVASWLEGTPEFIGVWLALKVAGGWSAWSDGLDVPAAGSRETSVVKVPGRILFNLSLANSAMSVIHSIAMAKGLQLHLSGHTRLAIGIASAPYILTWGIALYAFVSSNRHIARAA